MAAPHIMKTGDRPIGALSTILRHNIRAVNEAGRKPIVADVPCGSCNACCRSPRTFANVVEHERAQFPDAVFVDELKQWVLPKRDDGSCAYLIDGKCTTYQTRPVSCRAYDCRRYLFVRAAPSNDPIILEALSQWAAPEIKTREDKIIFVAIGLLMENEGIIAVMRANQIDAYDVWGKVMGLIVSKPALWEAYKQQASKALSKS